MIVVAVDIGGTKTTAGLVDLNGDDAHVRHLRTTPTPAELGREAVLKATAHLIADVVADQHESGGPAPDRVAVGSAGVIDAERGLVVAATDAIRQWAGTPLAHRLRRATGLPVTTLNDVHAHAVGEAVYGRGRGRRSMLLVTAGTGVGGSFVVDGDPWFGSRFAAGHLGHVPVPEAAGLRCPCGRSGHVEALASGPGLYAAYRRAGGAPADAANAGDVAQRAADGDALAREAVSLAGRALGRAMGGALDTLDPEIVVLSGGLSGAGPLWWAAVREAAAAETMELLSGLEIATAARGGSAALIGAAEFARRRG